MSGNYMEEIEVTFLDDYPSSIKVKNEWTNQAYLAKSQIECEGKYNEIKPGNVIKVTAPHWLLQAQDLV
tara:strand:+ start:1410 stop:1616 length:207 start_codon:yes stop_codon:yes gene_type:complete